MFTALAKGEERKAQGGSRGSCRKMGRRGAHSEQAAVNFIVGTYIVYVLCVSLCACVHLSRTHASPRPLPGLKSVPGWTSAARSSNSPVLEVTRFSSSHKILRFMFKKSTLQVAHGNSKII